LAGGGVDFELASQSSYASTDALKPKAVSVILGLRGKAPTVVNHVELKLLIGRVQEDTRVRGFCVAGYVR
jgi:hypothetical protein